MSGGRFDYDQYRIGAIADQIEQILIDYEGVYKRETLVAFKKAITALKRAQVYAQRIDWLVCGDDGEDSFHCRLDQELAAIGCAEESE